MNHQELSESLQESYLTLVKIDNQFDLDHFKSKYLGKTGIITQAMKSLSSLPHEVRKEQGSIINELKKQFELMLNQQKVLIADAVLEKQLAQESLDVTLPGRGNDLGGLHPIRLTLERMVSLFGSIGFQYVQGPEIENDHYNFTKLNIPDAHPARAMQDTFYTESGHVLRTHTSPIQIRWMEQHRPPIRIVAPGRVYRVESDATHSPMFHQMEGLWIDTHISFADLKSVMQQFLRLFFENDQLKVRFRPSFFPFTEPSAEIDVWDERRGWLELGGCGMVHPKVLHGVGLSSEEYSGFAFGVGIDRFAMLRYGISDLRLFFEHDLEFLKQFNTELS